MHPRDPDRTAGDGGHSRHRRLRRPLAAGAVTITGLGSGAAHRHRSGFAGRRVPQVRDGLADAAALAKLSVLSPLENLRVLEECVQDTRAGAMLQAQTGEYSPTGVVTLVRESGAWKVADETWDLGWSPEQMRPRLLQVCSGAP